MKTTLYKQTDEYISTDIYDLTSLFVSELADKAYTMIDKQKSKKNTHAYMFTNLFVYELD